MLACAAIDSKEPVPGRGGAAVRAATMTETTTTKGTMPMEEPERTGAGPESTGKERETREGLREQAPRIYVASLSDYNAGRLHGIWISLDDDIESTWSQLHGMLAASPEPHAEEWAIHDYEGFGPLALDEWENIAQVQRVANGIAEHGEAFAHWAALLDRRFWDDQLERFGDHYQGTWSTVEAFAEQMLDDLGVELDDIGPTWLQPYISIDVAAFARDLTTTDYRISEGKEGVHVFDW
jgi:antirestriction protein